MRDHGSDFRIVGWIVGWEFSLKTANLFRMWWPGTELNRRRQPFQGCALPPELPGHARTRYCCQHFAVAEGTLRLGGNAGNRRQANTGRSETAPIIAIGRESLNERGRDLGNSPRIVLRFKLKRLKPTNSSKQCLRPRWTQPS